MKLKCRPHIIVVPQFQYNSVIFNLYINPMNNAFKVINQHSIIIIKLLKHQNSRYLKRIFILKLFFQFFDNFLLFITLNTCLLLLGIFFNERVA